MENLRIGTDDNDYLQKSLQFVRKALENKKVSQRDIIKNEHLAEEIIVLLTKHAPKGAVLKLSVSSEMGDIILRLKMKGEEFEHLPELNIAEEDVNDEEAESAIREIFLRAYGERYKYSHDQDENKIRIQVGKSEKGSVFGSFIAIVLGLIFGVLIKNVFPEPVAAKTAEYVLEPVRNMFLNAFGLVVAPVIFFSLTTCISQFKNITQLGKLAAKIMGFYMFTTVIATTLGFTVALLIKPGVWGFAIDSDVDISGYADISNQKTSLIDTITGIVPGNLLTAFTSGNMLQVMFLGILIGIVLGMIGEYATILRQIFESCNTLFLTITTMIAKLVPVAVFCSVSLMVINTGLNSLMQVLSGTLVTVLIMVIMMCCYGVLLFMLSGVNPFLFFNKTKEGMVTSLSLCSSSAAMPTNLRICKEELGIAPAACNFTIPLGATVNMDGSSIIFSSFLIFISRAYGIEMSLSMMLSAALTIMLLSLSAPGVPGNGIVCMGLLLAQIGFPMQALALVITANPILDMTATVNNITGDMVGTLIVAKSEKMIDFDVLYNRKKG